MEFNFLIQSQALVYFGYRLGWVWPAFYGDELCKSSTAFSIAPRSFHCGIRAAVPRPVLGRNWETYSEGYTRIARGKGCVVISFRNSTSIKFFYDLCLMCRCPFFGLSSSISFCFIPLLFKILSFLFTSLIALPSFSPRFFFLQQYAVVGCK